MPRAARKKSLPDPDPVLDGPDPHMHSGKCTICRHPQCAEIERAFLDWTSPGEIAKLFGIRSLTTIYRHAHARRLFVHRLRNLHMGLGRIAEQVADAKPSAANIIAAFVAMAKINARGEWNSGTRFNYYEAYERARWERESIAERERDLSDLLSGNPTSEQRDQQRYRELEAMTKAAAAKAVERARAEQVAKQEEEQQEAEIQEEEKDTQEAPHTQPPGAEPSARPTAQAQNKNSEELEPELQPQPTPQPPANAPRLEDTGPPQVAGLPWPWPREKIGFNRRRWRPPLH